MFEVGKKVICIKSHSEGAVKKGQVFELLAIKKHCCKGIIVFDIGIQETSTSPYLRCTGPMKHLKRNDFIWWIASHLFAPYDDSLSSITVEELLEQVEYTAEVLL